MLRHYPWSLLISGVVVLAISGCLATGAATGGAGSLLANLAPGDPHAGHLVAGSLGAADATVPAAFSSIGSLTINVTVDEQGFSPSIITVPSEAKVRLVLRNRGAQEHHFHVSGLNPSEMRWLVKDLESGAPVISTGPDDHAAHHGVEMAPYHICTARGGICPTGLDVHAHAGPGDVDLILFTTADKGSFAVSCPLHPWLQGKVVVF